MLMPIQDLPAGVSGVMARGTVTRHDYRAVLKPMLRGASSTKKPLRLLYAFGPDFHGFTPGAAWEDAHLAFDHLSDLQCCAVVCAESWIKAVSQLAGALTSRCVRTFDPDEMDAAVEWLDAHPSASGSS